jgi:hypothetical protein
LVFAISTLLVAGPEAQQLSLGGPPEEVFEDAVEKRVEDQAEESLQERVEDRVEEAVLTLGDAGFEAYLQQKMEEAVEDSVEDAVEDTISDNIEVTIEGNVEDDIEEQVEETIEAIVEESVEESVQSAVEDRVEDSVTESVAQNVEESLEEAVEDELSASVEENLEAGVEAAVAQGVEAELESEVEGQIAAAVEERLEADIDEILERIEIDENRIQKDQWLVMAAPEVFEQLAEEGYLFDAVTELPGMGLRLAEVAAPSSFDITQVRQGVVDVVGKERAQVDLNHIYTAGDQIDEASGQGLLPRQAVSFPDDIDEMPLRIGMIDSLVDASHPALDGAHIQSRSFAPEGARLPSFHGTAIASIIAGNGAGYRGIAPRSEMYAAAVFEQDERRGEIASTVSLVRALDWLLSSGVDVINISLAGPPNRLLEAALERASERDVLILAAAGNGGPVAEPMYPAAYKSVVAVTAVDARGQVFRLANRGDYLDLAAPGVGMLHARSGGGYASSSGTSFAVPFAATAVARLRQLQPAANALELLFRSAQDLGPPGRDNIYGYGLLRPAS